MISPTMCAKKAVHIPETPCGCEFYMVLVDETETTSIYDLHGVDGVIASNIQVEKSMCSNHEITIPVVTDVAVVGTAKVGKSVTG